MLQCSGSVDCIHTRELGIESIKCQKTTGHAHIISITGEGGANHEYDCCSEESIATKAEIGLQAHSRELYNEHNNIRGVELVVSL